MNDNLLHKVSKPSRYIGGELNAVPKDPRQVKTRVALAFPDAYEIGMSHLGLKILYHILNRREDTLAERVFAPWGDMETLLRNRGIPLTTLESDTPLREFDVLGITLPYELCYTNILTLLDLAGLPLRSSERDASHPLVIGGGTVVFNPEPVADFFDAFVLGDGEEVIHEVVVRHQGWKEAGGTKEDLLRSLAEIAGVYIPSFYEVTYRPEGPIEAIKPRPGIRSSVKRRIVEDMDRVPFPDEPAVPYMQTVHDRLTVEVARGCTFGCRFCQAGMTYRPVRERSPENILKIVEKGLEATGYEEVSLVSLSTGDYACLTPLLTTLVHRHQEDRISFSLPSLRIGTLTREMIQEVTRTKNRGFTIAPEAGSERLRRVINKPISEDEMEMTVARVFEEGGKAIKLYFMLGLPTEDYEDLDGIVRMAEKVLLQAKKYGKGGREITVSVSTYVPKAHTPFQWVGQVPMEEVRARGAYLRERLKRLRVSFKQHASEMSYIEAVFSRGDRRLAPVLETAWRAGCRFDGWEEHLNLPRWMEVLSAHGIDPSFYAHRTVPMDEILPWEHLDTGAGKDFLILDFQRSMKERVIPDCRYGKCYNCGVCVTEALRGREEGLKPIAYRPEERPDGNLVLRVSYPKKEAPESCVPASLTKRVDERRLSPKGVRKILRIQYTKLGKMRWLSQLEVMTLFQRALRRAKIPVAYSEGFNPHPKLSFGPALPVGTEGFAELLDMEVILPAVPAEVENRLNPELPEGLSISKIWEVPIGGSSLNQAISGFAYEVGTEGSGISASLQQDCPAQGRRARDSALEDVERAIDLPDLILVKRKGREDKAGKKPEKTVDLRPFIEEVRWISNDRLALFLKNVGGTCCRPAEVIEGIFGPGVDKDELRIIRTGLYASVQGQWVPMEFTLANSSAVRTFVAC